jgi:hypothetical protein
MTRLLLRVPPRRLGPPQDGADAGQQFAQAEGLRDVIVGAELEPHDSCPSPPAGGP